LRAIYPGSFDPVTLGHLNLIRRAAATCQELVVAVIDNPNKKTVFTLAERQELLALSLDPLKLNVRIDAFSGLLVDYLRQQSARLVYRGLRDGADVPLELQMARLNQQMYPEMETLFLASAPELAHVSSSFVREIARLGGPFDAWVPPVVAERLKSKLKQQDKT
jgi:pantetheine-phosphate adenylyltransferase